MADDSRRRQIPFSRWRFREVFLAPRGSSFRALRYKLCFIKFVTLPDRCSPL